MSFIDFKDCGHFRDWSRTNLGILNFHVALKHLRKRKKNILKVIKRRQFKKYMTAAIASIMDIGT